MPKTAAYIAEEARALQQLAEEHKYGFLAYLLAMVRLEAGNTAARRRSRPEEKSVLSEGF